MRILAIQPFGDAQGHYEKYTSITCHALGELGHEVVLCTSVLHPHRYVGPMPRFELRELGARYSLEGFDSRRHRSLALWLFGRIRNNVATLRLARGAARRQQFDIAQIMSYELVSTWAVLSLPGGSLPPSVMSISAPNFDPRLYPGGALAKGWKRLQRGALQRLVDNHLCAIDVISWSHIAALREQIRTPRSFPIRHVSDGRFIPANVPSQAEARRYVGLEGYTGPVFLYFGVLRAEKGLEYLLQAVADPSMRSCHVVVAGAPADWPPDRLASEVDRLGLSDRVTLHIGFVPEEDVASYYCAADAVVLPYSRLYTGSSGPLYDAVAYGRPVIATEVSELGRLVDTYKLGWVVEPSNASALRAAMQELVRLPPSELSVLQSNAVDFAYQHSPMAVAQRYESLYREVLAQRGRQ